MRRSGSRPPARARSCAARGGGVCWFACFSTHTAPERAGPAERLAPQLPLDALRRVGGDRQLVERGDQPAEAELVAQRQRRDADDAAVLGLGDPHQEAPGS